MITVTIMGVITPAMIYLYSKVSQGMADDEMHTELQQGNQTMLNRIEVRMGGSHHFFMGDQSGVSYLGYIDLSQAPATVAGSALAQAQTGVSGSLSASVTDFTKAYVGNSLFFGAYDTPQTIYYSNGMPPFYSTAVPKAYTNVPVTLSGASMKDDHGTQWTIVIDLYRLYYYYLTSTNTKQLRDATAYSLVEWQSKQMADYHEVSNYSGDVSLQGNILAGLEANGVSVAWDPTQADPSAAFVTFGAISYGAISTGAIHSVTTYKVPMEITTNVTKTPSGILTTGFRYGISPNSNNWSSAPVVVPLFAPVTTAGVAFPNGFEVAAGNNPTGREIMVRSAWVAEGASSDKIKAVYNDINMVDEITDNW